MKYAARYVLIFLGGVLLMLSISFYNEWSYEEQMLGLLSKHIFAVCPAGDDAAIADTAIAYSCRLLDPMKDVFAKDYFTSPKSFFTSPAFYTFYYGDGACGGYSIFVAALFKKMGYKVKFVEQQAYHHWGAHITICLEKNNKLFLIDPINKCVFKDSLGQMADINTVVHNWKYYRKELPAGYDSNLNYQGGWRYTDWDKLGFMSRGIYKAGSIVYGRSRMDGVSIRYYMLRASKYYCIFSITSFLVVIFFLWKGLKTRQAVGNTGRYTIIAS